MNREATSTIKGYFYQFDRSILELLESKKLIDSITVEGIEDIDLTTSNGIEAVQCKYYEASSFTPSKIAKPIRLMLSNYKNRLDKGESKIKYKLYGYYKDGQDKLPSTISLKYLKETLLTYKHKKVEYKHHKQLKVKDVELQDFLKNLVIDIRAEEFQKQQETILNRLKSEKKMLKNRSNIFALRKCTFNYKELINK